MVAWWHWHHSRWLATEGLSVRLQVGLLLRNNLGASLHNQKVSKALTHQADSPTDYFIEPPAARSRPDGCMFCSSTLFLWALTLRDGRDPLCRNTMDLGRPSTDRHEICKQNWGDVKADHLLSIFFSPIPEKFGEEKLQFSRTAVNWKRITSKRLNISTNKYQTFHLG